MKLTSTQRDLRALLTSGYYKVPRFQRPYSWKREELEELWTDVLGEGEAGYFLGSIVAFTAGPAAYGIVDGQQRLMTITILLCCIRDALAREGHEGLATGLHRAMIERPDVKSLPQCVLQPEASAEYFYQAIQRHNGREKRAPDGEEETNLLAAHRYLVGQVDASIDAIRTDPTVKEDSRSDKIKDRLERLRDLLLDTSVIFVELDDDDDACLVFETLNARGKDLRVSDLVKNHLARHLKQRTRTVDPFKTQWERVIETIEGSSASVSVDSFIHHHWLSTHDYTSEKKLFRAIKKGIRRADANRYLGDLVRESPIYRSIFEPDSVTWRGHEASIRDSLLALAVFGVRQPAPFVLSLLSLLRSGGLRPRQVLLALNAVEVFHFKFTAIAKQSSSGGISQMYAKHARQVREAPSSEDAVRSIRELREKLRERLPADEEFDAGFQELAYSNARTRDRRLVRYTLGRIARHGLKTTVLDFDQMTIEHIAPQSTSEVDEEMLASIGNLVLVNDKLNQKLADKPFSKKRRALGEAKDVWVDQVLTDASAWAEGEIETRAQLLAGVARDKVWRI